MCDRERERERERERARAREREREREREHVCLCVCLCVPAYTLCDRRQVSVCLVGQMVLSTCIKRDKQIHSKRPANLSKKAHKHTIYVCQKKPTNTSKDTQSGSVGTVQRWYNSYIYEKNPTKRRMHLKRDP